VLLAVANFTTCAFADTIILKNGEKLDGKIVSETAQDVTIEYKVSASITDTRTVAKSEIGNVEKETPDSPAFMALQNLKIGPNSLPLASYDQVMKGLQGFLDKYPQSTHDGEIAERLTAFATEKTRVAGGELKFNHHWLTREEAQKERYQLEAGVVFAQMQEQTRRGDLVGALNTFDQLEKAYPGARVFPDAVDLAKQALPALRATAERGLQNFRVHEADRAKGLILAREPEKSQMIAAQAREQAAINAELEADSKSGQKWPRLLNSDKVLTALATKPADEIVRLNTLPVAKMRQSLEASDKAKELFAKDDVAGADAALKEADSLWSANEIAARLTKEISDKKNMAVQATPAPATPKPTPAADPMAIPPPAATPAPAPAPVASTPVAAPDGGPNYTLYGVLALVLLSLCYAGILAYKKIKARANEIIE